MQPLAVNPLGFNASTVLPCSLTTHHIKLAMDDFITFLTFMNQQLSAQSMPRLESFLMSANFSSIVGEFISATIPKYCNTLVKNTYHNGHPDLIPNSTYENDSCKHGTYGVEIKGSRNVRGWQGHNPEETWLMVFVFDSNTATDTAKGVPTKPFRFIKVVGAQLVKEDWSFYGRSETSRRTITATVNRSGYDKMESNWIYRHDALQQLAMAA